ncbi:MAG TPA: carbohydrate kinase family protein [Longimicrobium sp.]|nr:carbohydrate kinase family protein [Longimicrobium sp.]
MKIGLVGTFVWDRIWTLADQEAGRPFETWGGVAYSLAAGAAALPEGWEIVPLVKVGRDLEPEAHAFLDTLRGVGDRSRILPVSEPNNRVELRYTDTVRRGERLTGGVPSWTWDELAPRLDGLDALYVNFLSGFEMGLDAAERLRETFSGPVYADLHSLFLGCPGAGVRAMRRLPEWERWLACFDAVQLNEDELSTLFPLPAHRPDGAAALLAHGPATAVVTLGADGAAFATRAPEAPFDRGASADEPRTGWIRPPGWAPANGDPTGCGDVWGVAAATALFAGMPIEAAVARANALAAVKLEHRGATGLHEHLLRRADAWRDGA